MRIVAAIIALCLPTSLMAEPMIVIGADGPVALEHPRGSTIDARASMLLGLQDRLIVVDGKGTRVFSGPGMVSFDRGPTAAPGRWTDIRALVGRAGEHLKRSGRMKTGVTRGANVAAAPTEALWTLNWPKGGHYCFDAAVGMIVKRQGKPSALDEARFTFAPVGGPTSSTEVVKAGRAYFLWPAAQLPQPGAATAYQVSSGGKTSLVTLSAVPVAQLDPVALARFVTERGCQFPLSLFATKADQIDPREP